MSEAFEIGYSPAFHTKAIGPYKMLRETGECHYCGTVLFRFCFGQLILGRPTKSSFSFSFTVVVKRYILAHSPCTVKSGKNYNNLKKYIDNVSNELQRSHSSVTQYQAQCLTRCRKMSSFIQQFKFCKVEV